MMMNILRKYIFYVFHLRIGISKNIFHNMEKVQTSINITNNKYVYKTAFTDVLRVVHFIVGLRMWKLDC